MSAVSGSLSPAGAEIGHQALIDAMSVSDDPARRGLAEHLGEPHHGRPLRIAKVETDPQFAGAIKERLRCLIGHFVLEEGIDFRLVRHEPTWKESGQRQFGENDKVATSRRRLFQQRDHSANRRTAWLIARDWTKLTCTDDDFPAQFGAPSGVLSGKKWLRWGEECSREGASRHQHRFQ